MNSPRLSVLALACLVTAAPVMAQETAPPPASATQTPPKCEAPVPLPPELKGFDTPSPLKSGASLETAPPLEPGRAYKLELYPALSLAYAKAPEKPPVSERFAGITTFSLTEAGTYAIAADVGVWIDVISGTQVVASSSHGHVPCTGVRKAVNFELQPGPYVLQLSGSPAAAATIIIGRKP